MPMANLKNWPPVFMPVIDWLVTDKQLSKAALADVAWNLAARCAESADNEAEVSDILAKESAAVLSHRKRR